MSDEQQAIAGVRKAVKELVDGTLRIQIDIEPRDKAAFHRLFPEIDTPVAIAPMQLKPQADSWGQEARQLKQSGFFRMPAVWREIASDAVYLRWLVDQPCAARSADCHGDIVPAHVRRIEHGAGTAIKPEYSAIALCDHHHQLQHNQGESAIGPPEWWDQQRIKHVSTWAWEALRYQLGQESWKHVHPHDLYAWAHEHGLEDKLPKIYLEGI